MGITASVLRDSRYAPVGCGGHTRLSKEQVGTLPWLYPAWSPERDCRNRKRNETVGNWWTGLAGATTIPSRAPPTN
jgi:hypothetical protein